MDVSGSVNLLENESIPCFTCFRVAQDNLSILNSTDTSANVADLLTKHFWFQREDFHQDQIICRQCWAQLSDFDRFYREVQRNYDQLQFVGIKLEPDDELGTSGPLVEVQLDASLDGNQLKQECQSNDEEENEAKLDSTIDSDDSSEEALKVATNKPKRKYTRKKNDDSPKKPKTKSSYPLRTAEQLAEEDEIIKTHVQYLCETCGINSSTFTQFLKHSSEKHGPKGFIVCCGKRYFKKVRLLEHVQQLQNPGRFKCDICFKSFISNLGVRRHKQEIHLPDELRIYGCERCPKRFARERQLQTHLKGHETLDNATVKCEICGKAFPTEALLKTHVKIRHTRPTDYICDVCAKGFYSKAEFLRHKQSHELTPAELRVQCDVCKQWLKNQTSFRKHYQRHQQGPASCDLCDHVSPNKAALAGHKRHRHREPTQHVCQECGKEFRKALTLREHMASHTGEALYSCSFCERTFNSNANMFSHRKKMHPREWLAMKNSQKLAQQGIAEVASAE
ncbi:transcription factor grauzone-like [Sabethes cyaneus]|uniref:transcription factor grauzone-like n=1 Tax=Sabethes cyaneus TaxID=53552 RepID=UPI00237DC312|nr:transcription factor grauzone-like [Sabethes cyaneus]